MSHQRNDRFDPVEAFLSGLSSGGLRLFVGLLAVIAAYILAAIANTNESSLVFPFDLLFMIFAWAEQGVWFVVGLAALLGGLILIYRFGLDEGGKLAWLAIFLIFTIYLLPKNFTREEWDGGSMSLLQVLEESRDLEIVVKRDWLLHLAMVVAFLFLFWFGPLLWQAAFDRLTLKRQGD